MKARVQVGQSPALWFLFLSTVAASSCSSSGSKEETETHFLACKVDDDCRKLGEAFSCVDRVCRQASDAGNGSGGLSSGGSSSGGSSSGGSPSDGSTANGGTTTSSGGAEQKDAGDCDCARGAYFPVCGTDGQTYDATCGRGCVPAAIACDGECPCAAPAMCPSEPPQQGAPCTEVMDCFYERCSTYGRLRAQCSVNGWTVETGACNALTCGPSNQCEAGQACVIRQGGAFIADCRTNTCDGLVQCGCVEDCVPGCTIQASVELGVTVTCNTCPQGGCP